MKLVTYRFLTAVTLATLLGGCASITHNFSGEAAERGVPLIVAMHGKAGKTDSVGGVDYYYNLHNYSGKTIKYVFIEVTPYNAVGDVAASEVGGKTTARLKVTGPIKSHEVGNSFFRWDNIWYNRSITCVELNSMEVVYMDETTETYENESLRNLLQQTGIENKRELKSCKPSQ